MGLAMLDGVAVGLAVGHGCHRRFGCGLWVSLSMWPWAMGRGYGAGFFLLGLLVSDGGSVFGYNGGWLCLCCGLSSDLWC